MTTAHWAEEADGAVAGYERVVEAVVVKIQGGGLERCCWGGSAAYECQKAGHDVGEEHGDAAWRCVTVAGSQGV